MELLFSLILTLQTALYPAPAQNAPSPKESSIEQKILTSVQDSQEQDLKSQKPPLLSSPTPIQHKADKPQDKKVEILTHDQYKLCYIPTFTGGGGYIYLNYCDRSTAVPARYDVFGRIGFYINKTWLCITAPDSVVVFGREKDYLFLMPCVINLRNQQWKIKEGSFYAHDEFYSIKDDGSYLYAAHKLDKSLYTHTLTSSMQTWQNTLAVPGNLSVVTWLAWDLMDSYGQERYFLRNNYSDKNTTFLYYNPASGHIAEYDAASGRLYCMYSNTLQQDWDWVVWGLCDDSVPPKENRAYFKPVVVSDTYFSFEDKDGNILRATRYGIHWGVPYTVSKSYLLKDTGNSPISAFATNVYMKRWARFVDANIGKNLHECPARGYNTSIIKNPVLPPTFTLTQEWITRLYHINASTDRQRQLSGVCGVCLLQAYQMIGELLHNPSTPLSSGGYFFDTQIGANPFPSFRARNSLLHATLQDILEYVNYPVEGHSEIFLRNFDRGYASSISMLPQYDWRILGRGTRSGDIDALLQRVVDAPLGSVFLFFMTRYDSYTGRSHGHAMPVLRLQSGVVAVPANALISTEEFQSRISPVHTVADLRERLTRFGTRHIELSRLGVLSIERSYHNIFENIISLNDCSGEGEDRRGNGLLPLPELLNQCISGRCEF